jgi:hypothetical protein
VEQITKYSVIKLIKVKKKSSDKHVLKKVNVYPYKLNKLGNAKACARTASSSVDYYDKDNKVVNFIVQDDFGNVVFVVRENIDGIYGNELGDLGT